MNHLYDLIDRFHLLDLKNPTHPSMFVEEAEYDMLILALPSKEKELRIDSYAFVFEGGHYYSFDKTTHTFVDLESMQKVYEILDTQTNDTMKRVAHIHESIDWMEEKLYANTRFHFMQYWLNHKKDLARIHRLLLLGVDVMEHFIKHYHENEDFLVTHFSDIHEHLERTNRSTLLAIEKLNNLYTFYTSRNNERMNRTIYLLTILSGIFLPLNLIVGYFGINTQGLPFENLSNGSSLVGGLMLLCIGLSIGIFLLFRRKF
ncbi:MAG: magnesium transporter CorA family protein [Epsilonproteobacteria bacterium]|nr:magnesium transporter CorA family protein [Campylobacterota bacterium]